MNGSPAVGITVSVPAGWSGSDWVARGPKGNDKPDGMAIRFYTVDEPVQEPGLAGRRPIAGRADRGRPRGGDPERSRVDGDRTHRHLGRRLRGQLVQLTIPSGRTPRHGRRVLSLGRRIRRSGLGDPGMTFDQNIIDVGGERLVVEAFPLPGHIRGHRGTAGCRRLHPVQPGSLTLQRDTRSGTGRAQPGRCHVIDPRDIPQCQRTRGDLSACDLAPVPCIRGRT